MRDRRVRSAFLGLILALPLLIHAFTPTSGQAPLSPGAPGLGLEIKLTWGPCPAWLVVGEVVMVLGLIFVAYQRHRLLIGRQFRGY